MIHMTLPELISLPTDRVPSFSYLATPYTRYPLGMEAAADHASIIAAELMLKGVKVFCPIAHSHSIAKVYPELNAHEFWMSVDRPFMVAAKALIVATMDGWDVSRGVLEEIDAFKQMGKPIYVFNPRPILHKYGYIQEEPAHP